VDRVLVVDKPSGMTSHDVVERVRRASGVRRVGHAGTLDPSATGVLVVLVGKATRLAEFLLDADKEYQGHMVLGVATDTQDADGRVVLRRGIEEVTEAKIREVFKTFEGAIEQIPPMVSAVKHGGTPLYVLARKGIVVDRLPRRVVVRRLSLVGYEPPTVEFQVVCSKGTYVRTLAHDIGEALGCGAHLGGLRRTRVGRYTIGEAVSLEEVERAGRGVDRLGYSMFEALDDWPALHVTPAERDTVTTGGVLEVEPGRLPETGQDLVRITDDGRQLIAVGRAMERGESAGGGYRIRPVRVFG